MDLQYISDSSENATGVYIPINEWDELKNRFEGIDQEDFDIPEFHKRILDQLLVEYKNSPEVAIDFDTAMDDIENTL